MARRSAQMAQSTEIPDGFDGRAEEGAWVRLRELVRIASPFVCMIGERWRTGRGVEFDYWRVEKLDSVIVLPVHRGRLVCARPTFRPGVGRQTLDFPGGRLSGGLRPEQLAPSLLERELGVPERAVTDVRALNHTAWVVNSSFSNQGLWGLVARIDPEFELSEGFVGMSAPATAQGVEEMLEAIDCLQCRAVLGQWARSEGN